MNDVVIPEDVVIHGNGSVVFYLDENNLPLGFYQNTLKCPISVLLDLIFEEAKVLFTANTTTSLKNIMLNVSIEDKNGIFYEYSIKSNKKNKKILKNYFSQVKGLTL